MVAPFVLLEILNTRVWFELASCTFPIHCTLYQLVDNTDDRIDGTDKLIGGIPFSGVDPSAQGDTDRDKATNRSVIVFFCNAVGIKTVRIAQKSSGRHSQAKSTVQPKGVPSSSFREYFLPIDAPESSTRLAMPILRILRASGDTYQLDCLMGSRESGHVQISWMRTRRSGSWLMATMRHFMGATREGRDSTYEGIGE